MKASPLIPKRAAIGRLFVFSSAIALLGMSAVAQTDSTQLIVVPEGLSNPSTTAKFQDVAKGIGRAGEANVKLNSDTIKALSGSLGQLAVFLTDSQQIKAAADEIANIVKNEPADKHSVLFDLQKQYQANSIRTYKVLIPERTLTINAAEIASGKQFTSPATSLPLDVNEAVALALRQAARSSDWLDPKTVQLMTSSSVLSSAANSSQAAALLARSYQNVTTQFKNAIAQPTDRQAIQNYVSAAAQFKAEFASQWPTIKDDPVARNAAAQSYNGLATQRILKAQYGVLTNFPPLSYEQVFYLSRFVVTLRDARGIFCSGTALTKNWVVSAGHCFTNRAWTDVRVVFDLDGLGSASKGLAIIDQWPEPAPGSAAKDDIDFAFVRVEDDPDVTAAYNDLEALIKANPSSSRLCLKTAPVGYKQPVFAVGFPMGQEKTVHDYSYVWFPFKIGEDLYNQMGAEIYAQAYKIETELGKTAYAASVKKGFEAAYSKTTSAGGQVSHFYYEAAYGTAMRPSFGIDTDTSGGDSGSPVVDRLSRCIVGIFSSGQRDTLVAPEASWREHEVAIPISEILERIQKTDRNQAFGGRTIDAGLLTGRDELVTRLKDVSHF